MVHTRRFARDVTSTSTLLQSADKHWKETIHSFSDRDRYGENMIACGRVKPALFEILDRSQL